jgi:tetratricopeptide (TPR) repeat protein
MRAFALALGTAIACFASSALAEHSARNLYEQGAQAYRESRHDEAAALFRKAFELEPHAELAYNLGRALEAGGHLRSAVESFRDYLRLLPEAKDRTIVERRIWNLERRIEASQPANPSPETPARQAPATATSVAPIAPRPSAGAAVDETRSVRPPTWIALGVSAGALGAAFGFELARRSSAEEVESAGTQIEHQDRYAAAERNRDLARVLAGLGGAAALTGGVLLYFDLRGRPSAGGVGARGSRFRALGAGAAPEHGGFRFVGHFRF